MRDLMSRQDCTIAPSHSQNNYLICKSQENTKVFYTVGCINVEQHKRGRSHVV